MARLTEAQKRKLPPELRIVVNRFVHEPQLYTKLKNILGTAAQKVAQHSLNHATFCDPFLIPRSLPKELLKLYGVTEKELKQAMQKIGFVNVHRMYDNIYYQTLSIAYLIGLEFDDKNVRRLALLLITILIWNGRKMKSFPSFCDPDIARYVMNYELKGNHTLKKSNGSAFEYLDSYNIPAFDDKYSKTIPNNLDDPREGLRKLIESEYGRIKQLFDSMKKAYYKVHKEGKKEVTSDKYGQQYGEGDMVESKESFSGTIERLVDKIEKNSMIKKRVLMNQETQKHFKDRFNISSAGIEKMSRWIEDDDNQDEVRYFYELVFTSLKPKSETDICKYDVNTLAKSITSAKKDPNLLKAKEILDHMLLAILGDTYKSKGTQTIYLLKSIASYALITYAKLMLCKKA